MWCEVVRTFSVCLCGTGDETNVKESVQKSSVSEALCLVNGVESGLDCLCSITIDLPTTRNDNHLDDLCVN